MAEDSEKNTVCSTYGCGCYQQALNKLEKDYEASFGYNKQRQLFEEFTRKFTTIPEIWIKWFELEADYNRKHRIDELRNEALKHFYSLDFIGFLRPDTTIVKDFSKLVEWPYLDILRFKCYNINPTILAEGLELAEKALTFPHWKLEEVYKIYSTRKEVDEVVKKNYRYSKFLKNLLSNAANDDQKWFTFLKMGRNIDFIIQNIEYKICKNPWNVTLWRMYIDYLKSTNSPDVLNVYSRFCRFFVDDRDILEEYRNEIQRMQESRKSVSKWWIDTLEFEWDFGTPLSTQFLFKKAINLKYHDPEFIEYALKMGKRCGLLMNDSQINILRSNQKEPSNNNEALMEVDQEEYEDFSDISTFYKPWGQRFSIPSTIIFQILKSSDHQLLSKLLACCKLFFAKFKVILCHGLVINNAIAKGFSPSGSSMDLELNQIVNFYLTNSLIITLDASRNILSWLRSVLYQCDVEILNLCYQDIPLNDFKFFVEKVTNVALHSCNITNENGEPLPIQDVIALFPNADKMKFFGNRFTPLTLNKLLELKRSTKIKTFAIYNVPASFTSADFAQFIKKNAAPSATFTVYFADIVPEVMKQEFIFGVRHELMQITENPPKISVY